MKTILVLGFMLLAASASAPAPAQETVIKEGQVDRDALIEKLAPPARPPESSSAAPDMAAPAASDAASAAEAAAPDLHTRSLRPHVHAVATPSKPAAAHPAHASVLITFVTDSADLTDKARQALDVVASAMKSERLASVHFTIEGHADPRGSDEHNLQLSQARADSVRAYLLSAHGLSAERITAVGKGSSDLLLPNDPSAPENRRVTIVAQP